MLEAKSVVLGVVAGGGWGMTTGQQSCLLFSPTSLLYPCLLHSSISTATTTLLYHTQGHHRALQTCPTSPPASQIHPLLTCPG